MTEEKQSRSEKFGTTRNRQKKSGWRKFGFIVLALVLIGGTTLGYLLSQTLTHVNQTIANIQTDSTENKTTKAPQMREKEVSLEEGEPINILLLGTDDDGRGRDESKGYVSRSDSMMVLSMNPKTHTTKILSIPRDVYTFIEGHDGPDKINHAYAYGGVNLTINTVQEFLNLPIDYYAVVNMQGLEQLVDAVGGVDITSPLTFTYQESSFVEGQTRHVDGWNAMNFARMRYDDPEGETGRQNRQKLVIKALVDKLASVESVANFPKLLEVVAKNVKTNIDLKQIMTIYPKYSPALQTITSIKFEGLEDLYLNEIYYFYAPMSSRLKVANELRRNSGLAPITAAALRDPLGNEGDATTSAVAISKTSKLIINQYPTGLTDSELQDIAQTQNSVQSIRQTEYYTPWVPESYTEPEVVAPVQPQQPSVPETTDTYTPETPADPNTGGNDGNGEVPAPVQPSTPATDGNAAGSTQ